MGEPSDYDTLIAQSMEELRLKTQAHDATWHLADADWSVDQNQGQIVFTHEGVTATAPAQIVGTFNSEDSTWLWGWDHPSVVPAMQEHAKRLREYGEHHGIRRLTTRKLTCSEDEAWELAAIACKICEAQGAYRGPAGTAFVFITFGDVTLSHTKPKKAPPKPSRKSPDAGTTPAATGAPSQVVREFIDAYFTWNTAANDRCKSAKGDEDREAAMDVADEEYETLIDRFCTSSVEPQGISFGDDSMHHPDHETIESETVNGAKAIVRTRKVGLDDFVSDYEYHLVQKAGEWRIRSLLYVAEDGKHECL